MIPLQMKTHNPSGKKRVIVTKELPGSRWLKILADADCRIEILTATEISSIPQIREAIGSRCDGAIGQLTETWGDELFTVLKTAGGKVYSNYAVGFNNVDVSAATRNRIAVGNTPGVLTETTAEMAVSLTFAAARRIGEAERFLRSGKYTGWLPTLFLGILLLRKTVGIVGAGRIGSAYARMMAQGHLMNVLYYDLSPNPTLEAAISSFGEYLRSRGEEPVTCRRTTTLEELLQSADCVSIHTVLDGSTRHLFNAPRLSMMKENAILINTSRGPVIDEEALVAHCKTHPHFRAGLDVFEDEPRLKPGLADLENVVILPHIASATSWTREGMAILAASNIAAVLNSHPVWQDPDIAPFLKEPSPRAAPSIINAGELHLPRYHE
ncbi:MAG: NAD(P)-dependent oxidoreductase [Thermodesulfobacteriota bacterium]